MIYSDRDSPPTSGRGVWAFLHAIADAIRNPNRRRRAAICSRISPKRRMDVKNAQLPSAMQEICIRRCVQEGVVTRIALIVDVGAIRKRPIRGGVSRN